MQGQKKYVYPVQGVGERFTDYFLRGWADQPHVYGMSKVYKQSPDLSKPLVHAGNPSTDADVANLDDLEDMLPQDEIAQMRIQQALALFMSCPVAPSWDVGPTRPSPPGMYG